MLNLHESRQASLRGAGIFDEFEKRARPEGQERIVIDRTGELLQHWKPEPGHEAAAVPNRQEIDRRDLRQLLIDGAPPGSIKYGHPFVSARQVQGAHAWEVPSANGESAVVNLLVGADSTHSRVRQLISPAVQPVYTGLQIFETAFQDQPALSARCSVDSVFAFDKGGLLGAQVYGGERERVEGYCRTPEDYSVPPNPDSVISIIKLIQKF